MPALEAEENLVYDDGDRDSTLGSESIDGSTASLRSSILQYRQEHGRTYHSYKDGKYSFPNDAIENERLDLQHHIFYLTFDGKLGFCPLNETTAKAGRVLDIGCGTGIWAVDYADEHPEAEVIGVDLSPIQPSFIPPNVQFQIDDIEEPWTFGSKFSYIHSRMMTASIADWDGYLQKCYDHLEPGGYLELQDCYWLYESDDNSLLESHALVKWGKLLAEAARKLGRPYSDPRKYKTKLAELGFENVHERLDKWPSNPWPKDPKFKELGVWMSENINGGLEGFSLALLTRGLGWTKEEVDVFLVDVRKDFKDRSIHSYLPIYSVYGKKPEK